MSLDLNRTAVLIIDPQKDFLTEGGVVWDLAARPRNTVGECLGV